MKINFILSDLDGVIRKFPSDRDAAIEQKHHLPSGAIFKAAFEKSILHKVVCGQITDEAWRQLIVDSITSMINNRATAQHAIDEWSDFSGHLDNNYLEFLDQRFPKMPVAILTNGTSRLMSDLRKLGIDRRFDRIFNTADIGFCKPDPKIFQHVVDALDCKPHEILFIDDSMSHILAAEEFGLQVRHYRSLVNLQSSLGSVLR